jgi:hypothetical protein
MPSDEATDPNSNPFSRPATSPWEAEEFEAFGPFIEPAFCTHFANLLRAFASSKGRPRQKLQQRPELYSEVRRNVAEGLGEQRRRRPAFVARIDEQRRQVDEDIKNSFEVSSMAAVMLIPL